MGIIEFIVVGAIIGWIAARMMGRHEGFIGSAIIGIVGSFIGGLISQLFTTNQSYADLTLSSFIWSLIGAVVLVGIMNAASGQRHHHAA